MLTITYASSAYALFSEVELTDLLISARENNLKNEITGLLLYKDGNFMQVIEGPTIAVVELYGKIVADTRHHVVMKLLEHELVERSFASWQMAFCNLNGPGVKEVPGYSDFLDASLTANGFLENPTSAQKLLRCFREKMR
jgi:hypothetical protein